MKIIAGANFSWPTGTKYPIVIDSDTTFRGCNFAQQFPHTEVFQLVPAPGSLVNPVLIFMPDDEGIQCNLVNVTVPDGAVDRKSVV